MRSLTVTHKIMSSIKSEKTKPEMILRSMLWKKNMRYRINYKILPGKPDIVFTKAKIAIFCDGDFCFFYNWAVRGLSSLSEELSEYSEFWQKKILDNVSRDIIVTAKLEEEGWTVLRFWESEIKETPEKCVENILKVYQEKRLK